MQNSPTLAAAPLQPLQKNLHSLDTQAVDSSIIESIDTSFYESQSIMKVLEMIRQEKKPGLHIIVSSTPNETVPPKLTFLKAKKKLTSLLPLIKKHPLFPIRLTVVLHTDDMQISESQQLTAKNSQKISSGNMEQVIEMENFLKFLIYFHGLSDFSLDLLLAKHGIIPIEFPFLQMQGTQTKRTSFSALRKITFSDPESSLSQQNKFSDALFLSDFFTSPNDITYLTSAPITKLTLKNLLYLKCTQDTQEYPKNEDTEKRHLLPTFNLKKQTQVAPQFLLEKLTHTFKHQERLIALLDQNFRSSKPKKLAQIEPEDEEVVQEYLTSIMKAPPKKSLDAQTLTIGGKGSNFPFTFRKEAPTPILKTILQLFKSKVIHSSTIEFIDTNYFYKSSAMKTILETNRQKEEPGINIIISSTLNENSPTKLTFFPAQHTLQNFLNASERTPKDPIAIKIVLHTDEEMTSATDSKGDLSVNGQDILSLLSGISEPVIEFERFLKFLIYFQGLRRNSSVELIFANQGSIPLRFEPFPLSREESKYSRQFQDKAAEDYNYQILPSLRVKFYDHVFLTDRFKLISEQTEEKKKEPVTKLYLRDLLNVNDNEDEAYDEYNEYDHYDGTYTLRSKYSEEAMQELFSHLWQILFLDPSAQENAIQQLQERIYPKKNIKFMEKQDTPVEAKQDEELSRLKFFLDWYRENWEK
jgi:hypothetical protein